MIIDIERVREVVLKGYGHGKSVAFYQQVIDSVKNFEDDILLIFPNCKRREYHFGRLVRLMREYGFEFNSVDSHRGEIVFRTGRKIRTGTLASDLVRNHILGLPEGTIVIEHDCEGVN